MKNLSLLVLSLLICLPVSAKEVNITLLQANDVYEMTPVNGGRYGGLARVQTLIKQLKAQNPNTYSILAGDFLSPSAIGTAKVNGQRLDGQQMVAVFNAMGWDYMTLGNHEFDNGRAPLLERLKEAQFTVFSSNVIDQQTMKPFANTQGTLIFEVEGVKVGMAGVMLQSLSKDFVRIENPLVRATQAVAELKQQGSDILLLVTHQSLRDDIELAEAGLDIDLILGGHEHENSYLRRGLEFTPIAKADANARSVYIHQLSYDTDTKTLQVASTLRIIDEQIAEDPAIKHVVEQWQEKAFSAFRADGFEPSDKVADSPDPLDGLEASVRNKQTRLTELVASSALHAYPDADLSIYNAGSIRIDEIIPAGSVSQYDVIRILPFGGEYMEVSMPGDLLLKTLTAGEANRGIGGFLHWDNVTKSSAAKVEATKTVAWLIKGLPLDQQKNYRVAISSFLIERGDTGLQFLVNNPRIKRLSQAVVDARLALIDELRVTYPTAEAKVAGAGAASLETAIK